MSAPGSTVESNSQPTEAQTPRQKAAVTRRINRVDIERASWIAEREKRLKTWKIALNAAEAFTEKFFALKLINGDDEAGAVAAFTKLQRLGAEWKEANAQVERLNAEVRPLAEVVVLKPRPAEKQGRAP